MGGVSLLTVVPLLLLSAVSLCVSDDQLTPAKPLAFPDGKLVSNDGVFALGFFSPTTNSSSNSSARFYLGIWYDNVPDRRVVWVANRDSPINSSSFSVALAVTSRSGLVLSDSAGHVYWTTAGVAGASAATAALLNEGNLVVLSSNGTVLWQSIQHPTDTILAGMPFRVSRQARFTDRLVSWKSPEDPSTGGFSLAGDVDSGIQYFIWNGSTVLWRSGAWNGGMVTSYKLSGASSVVVETVVADGDEISLTFSVSDGSPGLHATMSHTGKYEFRVWDGGASAWTLLDAYPAPGCDRYASCGPFGYCDVTEAVPTCKCPDDGFEPDPSGGCARKEPLRCGDGDHFVTLQGVKTPAMPVFVRNRTSDECMAECRSNCSCTAYAYANMSSAMSGGDLSRCLLWFGDLVDMGRYLHMDGEDLYLRLADSPPVRKKSTLLKILLPTTACLLLLTFGALVWTCKNRGKRQKKRVEKRKMLQYLSSTIEAQAGNKNSLEFPFIRFEIIAEATANFSDSNIIGQGGFGKVYKGVLEGTKEVAVKRLSKGSGQGTEEFRNEVVLIAKLQHKNLVKLFGCCIHEDEKLLVYEYLPNKSLDCFLFDPARKPMLQWPTRFKIIQGVARGIMYLHQDSRLTIIHRDLKASNILLDKEMSPKISDFGMARIFCGDQLQENTNRVVGTYGYMSPEYAMEGKFSVKSDTYSFGVLLLEIVNGLKISSPHVTMDFPNLIDYAWNLWKDSKTEYLLDPSITDNFPVDEVSRCIHIGLLCVQDSPDCRPLMSAVVFMLENKATPLPTPIQPVYFARRVAQPGMAGDNNEFSVNNVSLTVQEGR